MASDDEKNFYEGIFSYAVADYLEDCDFDSDLKKDLEVIASEPIILGEKHFTRDFLTRLVDEDELYEKVRAVFDIYLVGFLKGFGKKRLF